MKLRKLLLEIDDEHFAPIEIYLSKKGGGYPDDIFH